MPTTHYRPRNEREAEMLARIDALSAELTRTQDYALRVRAQREDYRRDANRYLAALRRVSNAVQNALPELPF